MKHVSRRRCVSIAATAALAGCLRFQDGGEDSEDGNPSSGELGVEWVYDPPETVGENPELAILYEGATADPTVEVEYYRNGQDVDTFTTTGDEGTGIVSHGREWEAGGAATIEIVVSDGDATSTETIEFEIEPETSDLEVVDLWAENATQTVGERDTYAVEYQGAAVAPDVRVEWLLDGDVVDRTAASGQQGADIVPLDHQWTAAGRAELVVIVSDGAESAEERLTFDVEPSGSDDQATEEAEDEVAEDEEVEDEETTDSADEQLTITEVATQTPQERGREYRFRAEYEGADVPAGGVNIHFAYLIDDRMRATSNSYQRSSSGRASDTHEWDRTGHARVEVTVTDQDDEVAEAIEFDVEPADE